MTEQIKAYCARSIIQHLNGDFEEFDRLANLAFHHFELERLGGFKVQDMIPAATAEELYKLVC